jgi:hypothetical protein
MKVLLRVPDDLYGTLKNLAATSGLSINALINKACDQYVASGDMPILERRISALEQWRAMFVAGQSPPMETSAKLENTPAQETLSPAAAIEKFKAKYGDNVPAYMIHDGNVWIVNLKNATYNLWGSEERFPLFDNAELYLGEDAYRIAREEMGLEV